jgi:Root hair defective 3 GTP-binding protein (RHD3)
MDVEGKEGREHDEDQDFERKIALFPLASSKVSTGLSPGFRQRP